MAQQSHLTAIRKKLMAADGSCNLCGPLKGKSKSEKRNRVLHPYTTMATATASKATHVTIAHTASHRRWASLNWDCSFRNARKWTIFSSFCFAFVSNQTDSKMHVTMSAGARALGEYEATFEETLFVPCGCNRYNLVLSLHRQFSYIAPGGGGGALDTEYPSEGELLK